MLRTGQAGNWSSSLGAPTDALTRQPRDLAWREGAGGYPASLDLYGGLTHEWDDNWKRGQAQNLRCRIRFAERK